MNKDTVSFKGTEVATGDSKWRVRWAIQQAAVIGERVIVLYDNMAGPRHEHFPNLEAFTPDGKSLWVAEHPIKTATDSYVSFSVGSDPSVISANSFACFKCRIETATGKLIEAEFTK